MTYAAICLFVVIVTFTLYLILDGKALALCALTPLVNESKRHLIFNAILPAWDANQTWLVFTLAALYGGFSVLFADIFSQLYLVFIAMFLLLIFRGAAIEFSMKATKHTVGWYWLLAVTSCLILVLQGGIVAFVILHQQIIAHNLHVSVWQHWEYYLLTTATLICFHLSRAIDHLQLPTRWCNRRYTMLALATCFSATVMCFDGITGFYNTSFWYAHLASIPFVFLVGWLLTKSKRYCISCYCTTLALTSISMVVLYLYPFSVNSGQSLLTTASSPAAMKVIAIASLIILPCLAASMTIIQRIFNQGDDAISY